MAALKPSAEDLQSLVERFGKAGWVTDTNIVGPRNFSLVFTPLGQTRLFQIFTIVENEKACCVTSRQPVADAHLPSIPTALEQTVIDIQPPQLTDTEWEMLKALAHGFATAASS